MRFTPELAPTNQEMAWMNSPKNARLALRRPQELVPQPDAGDSPEAHCGPVSFSSLPDRGRPHVIICEPSTLGDDPEAGRRVLRGPLVEAPSARCRTAQRCETAGRWPEGGYAVVVGALRCRAARAPLKGRGGRARSMLAPANESPRGHHFTHSSLRRTLRNKDLTPSPTWWTVSPPWKIGRPT